MLQLIGFQIGYFSNGFIDWSIDLPITPRLAHISSIQWLQEGHSGGGGAKTNEHHA